MEALNMSFTAELSEDARALLFGSDQYWQHLRASVSEGICPRCRERLEPVAHTATTAGYCTPCDTTFFTGGPDKEWAESGEQVGRP